MFSRLEEKIQHLTFLTRRSWVLGFFAVALILGYLADNFSFEKVFNKFELVVFIGNILLSFSLISFFTFRRKFSKKPYTAIHYFSQTFIIISLIIKMILTSDNYLLNEEKSLTISIINILIWYAITLNISLIFNVRKFNDVIYYVKKETNPTVYLIYTTLLVIPLFQILNLDIMYSIYFAHIVPLSLLITSIENFPLKNDKNELILCTLFTAFFCISFHLGTELNTNKTQFHFLNEIAIFFSLGILSFRNQVKLSTEFNKIHEISITLARKMGELSLMHIEAQKSEKAKENFLATMSHEIRTPVNGIIGHAELLNDTDISDEQRRLLSMITISSNNLMKLINEVLDLPNLISGHIILSQEVIEVSELVESVIDVVSPKSFEKGLDLTYFIEPSVPQEIIGDSKRIGQILLNLCNNALKFTEKGEVFIGVTQIDQVDENLVELLFEVKDTGIGIPANKIKKLFKAYSQTDASISRKFGGTGLGLAISAQLIELMKGKIWVESVVGKGTRFIFTLKCQTPNIFTPPKFDTNELNGLKCLVISENPTMRYILARRFKQWKINAKIVAKFEEAQSVIGLEEFRILIVDIIADNKKAIMFLKANQINPIGKIPSIALVSLGKNATPDLPQLSDETITKPLKTETLAKTLLNVINKKQKSVNLTIKPQQEGQINSLNISLPLEKIKATKILVAEDNPVNQKLIASILKKMGFLPKLVENGRLAVEEVEKETYDIILMDLQMPEMDGISATKNIIINARNKARPKIIALTANAMPGDKERCIDAGMDDYISKPIQFQILLETLKKWVDLSEIKTSPLISQPSKNITSSEPQQNAQNIAQNIEPKLQQEKVSNNYLSTENKVNSPDNTIENKENITTPFPQNKDNIPMNSQDKSAKTPQELKILVAEDNAVNQKLTISILKKLGYTAKLVENGALAVEAATKENFDIIIMDLQMPVMDGLDATRNIKASAEINPKPIIIALTANAMVGDKERCLNAGMDDYMTKPIQIKVLEENLKKWGNIK